MSPVPITAVAMANGLGRTTAEVLAALQAGGSGLRRSTPEDRLPFDTWVARVPGALAPLPEGLAAWDTRQARLAAHLMDELRPALSAAVARWGASRVGIAIGTTTGGIGDTEDRYPAWRDTGAFPDGYDLERQHNLHATADFLAALTGLRGPAFVQSSACSSSAKVLASAKRLLALGVVDAMVVGGIDSASRFTLLGFHGLGILSDKPCAPFAADRDGINLGEAGALMLLEREGDAIATLRGVGETSDAHHLTQPAPDGEGLARAIRAALDEAGLAPDAIDLVNAHATGTPLNDAAEVQALAASLPHHPPVVGTKGYTAHTLGAAGATEAVLAVLAVQHGWSPGTRTRAPVLDSPIPVATERVDGPFRHVLSTSAAFAGHNAAVIVGAP
jgi:3-oxoacyl-[acyl-carrier-protein] synthase-1